MTSPLGPRLRLLVVALACALMTVGATPASALPTAAVGDTAPALRAAVGDTLPEPNPFLPEERNLSDCLSSLPKPGCGSEARGGWLQFATFGVLMLGMAFIGWRVFRSVKRRDAAPPFS